LSIFTIITLLFTTTFSSFAATGESYFTWTSNFNTNNLSTWQTQDLDTALTNFNTWYNAYVRNSSGSSHVWPDGTSSGIVNSFNTQDYILKGYKGTITGTQFYGDKDPFLAQFPYTPIYQVFENTSLFENKIKLVNMYKALYSSQIPNILYVNTVFNINSTYGQYYKNFFFYIPVEFVYQNVKYRPVFYSTSTYNKTYLAFVNPSTKKVLYDSNNPVPVLKTETADYEKIAISSSTSNTLCNPSLFYKHYVMEFKTYLAKQQDGQTTPSFYSTSECYYYVKYSAPDFTQNQFKSYATTSQLTLFSGVGTEDLSVYNIGCIPFRVLNVYDVLQYQHLVNSPQTDPNMPQQDTTIPGTSATDTGWTIDDPATLSGMTQGNLNEEGALQVLNDIKGVFSGQGMGQILSLINYVFTNSIGSSLPIGFLLVIFVPLAIIRFLKP